MDTTTQPANELTQHMPPAQLWIGSHDTLVAEAHNYLQQLFCTNNGCRTCATCMQIRQQQHHGSIWLYPEKQYTLEQLKVISSTISFALQPEQHIFFVVQKADFLTIACANSLLKSLEEPPPGYHFLLLAHRHDALLPTIRSRCIVKTFTSTTITPEQETLYAYFVTTHFQDPAAFLKTLDQSKITERESVELLDILLTHWIERYTNAIANHDTQKEQQTQHVISALEHALQQPPMPGSSKIFWKNLFLQVKQ